MSDGPKKNSEEIAGPNVISLDGEEFNNVLKRMRDTLASKAERAKERKEKAPSRRSSKAYVEASKDIFVFVHLLELVESMTEEISDLRDIISALPVNQDDRKESPTRNVGWHSADRKRYIN